MLRMPPSNAVTAAAIVAMIWNPFSPGGEPFQSSRQSDAMTELRSYVERFTGPEPADCGQHALARPFEEAAAEVLRKSVACATAAVRDRKPFWTYKQSQGIDSFVFSGLLGTSEGAIYRFDYDSAPCGGPGCGGRFSIERCAQPTVVSTPGQPVPRFACGRLLGP